MIINSINDPKGEATPGCLSLLVVLLGLGCLVMLVLDNKSSGKDLKSQIEERERRLSKLGAEEEEWMMKISDYADKQKMAVERRKIENQLKEKQALINEGNDELAEKKSSVAKIQREYEKYKNRYIIHEREFAIGEKIDQLTIKNGKKYEQVVIRKITNGGMHIKHKNGGARIECKLLPDDLFERFQFSANSAQVANGASEQLQKDAASSSPSKLGNLLTPLERPNLSSAKIVMKALAAHANAVTGNEREDTLEMAATIKALFSAEYRVAQAIKSQLKKEIEARQHDKNARDWMLPTRFNPNGRPEHANASILKAEKIRKQAANEIKLSRQKLRDEMKKTDTLTLACYENQKMRSTVILFGVLKAINKRAMGDAPFTPTVTEQTITKARTYIANIDRWRQEAASAEVALNFEKAFRLFSKAQDSEGRKRCSLRLAKKLEEQKLYGSACDYYEIANDFVSAARIQKEHPDLIKKSFSELNAEDLYAKAAPACVRILASKSKSQSVGSGFLFKMGGYILTNNHVIDGANQLEILTHDGKKFKGKVLAKSKTPDLAVVKIELAKHEVIRLGNADLVKIGTPTVLIGYPKGFSTTATMNAGMISNTQTEVADTPCFQLDVSANHGNSGGPVMMSSGRVIGILTFGLGGGKIDRFNFAIRVNVIREFLQKELGDAFGEQ